MSLRIIGGEINFGSHFTYKQNISELWCEVQSAYPDASMHGWIHDANNNKAQKEMLSDKHKKRPKSKSKIDSPS